MNSLLVLKILVTFHVTFAALFVGGNVFMDFLLSPRLDLIPPGQAARLGEKLGNDFAIFNWVCLIGIMISGMLIMWKNGLEQSIFDPDFIQTSYGAALLVKEIIAKVIHANGDRSDRSDDDLLPAATGDRQAPVQRESRNDRSRPRSDAQLLELDALDGPIQRHRRRDRPDLRCVHVEGRPVVAAARPSLGR